MKEYKKAEDQRKQLKAEIETKMRALRRRSARSTR